MAAITWLWRRAIAAIQAVSSPCARSASSLYWARGTRRTIAAPTELYELRLHLLSTPPGIPLGIRLLFDLFGDEPEPTDGARDGEKQHVSQQTHRAPPPTATQCRRSCKAAMVPRTERSGAR